LIGPNGAGKTTAINTLCGVVQRQAGEIEVDGRLVNPRPRRLVEYGIGRTFQKPAIFLDLSALENVLVGAHAQSKTGLIRGALSTSLALSEERDLTARAIELLRAVGYDRDPNEPATRSAFGAHRQIEVARTLMSEPRILLLDEPTAGLTGAEIARLAAMLRSVRDERGVTILLVEHNVPFVFGSCNTVTAMHEGSRIATGTPGEIRINEAVVESYLGPHHGEPVAAAPIEPQSGEVTRILEVRDLTSGYGSTTIIRDANLHVGTGEIVALLGRNGAGKTTLLNTVLGNPRARGGDVVWEGRSIRRLSTDRIVAAGIGLVPQQRAIIARQSVDDNLQLATFGIRLTKREYAERI
ncbi:MAG: ATP-binding cassette domain-containing protein, partial [Vulcanimicrobiaceae bacterium]